MKSKELKKWCQAEFGERWKEGAELFFRTTRSTLNRWIAGSVNIPPQVDGMIDLLYKVRRASSGPEGKEYW